MSFSAHTAPNSCKEIGVGLARILSSGRAIKVRILRTQAATEAIRANGAFGHATVLRLAGKAVLRKNLIPLHCLLPFYESKQEWHNLLSTGLLRA